MANMDGEYKGIGKLFEEWVRHPLDESIKSQIELIPVEKLDGAVAFFTGLTHKPWYRRMETYTNDRKENERLKRTRRQRCKDLVIGAILGIATSLLVRFLWYLAKQQLDKRG